MGETETKTNITPPLPCATLSSNSIALLGLQEVMHWYWLDIEGLGLVSMLSIRARRSANESRSWRYAVRAMFPRHPFEVKCDGLF